MSANYMPPRLLEVFWKNLGGPPFSLPLYQFRTFLSFSAQRSFARDKWMWVNHQKTSKSFTVRYVPWYDLKWIPQKAHKSLIFKKILPK
jgi:hypothetical protein